MYYFFINQSDVLLVVAVKQAFSCISIVQTLHDLSSLLGLPIRAYDKNFGTLLYMVHGVFGTNLPRLNRPSLNSLIPNDIFSMYFLFTFYLFSILFLNKKQNRINKPSIYRVSSVNIKSAIDAHPNPDDRFGASHHGDKHTATRTLAAPTRIPSTQRRQNMVMSVFFRNFAV